MKITFRFFCGALICTVFILTALPPALCSAGSKRVIDSEEQFAFAEHYFSRKDYDSAVGEYQRYIYYFPDDENVEQAMYKIGLSYQYGGRFNDAVEAFNALIKKYRDTEISLNSYLRISECYARNRQYGNAVLTLQDLIKIVSDADLKDKALYQMGWLYIEMAKWDHARQALGRISPKNRSQYRLDLLSEELDQSRLIDRKDPTLAGFLSVLPGAGYAYCGQYHDATVALLLNGALGYAAYESFDHGLTALGAVIAFVELGFYAGNIYGGINSAHKYNKSKTDGFIRSLKQRAEIHVSTASDRGTAVSGVTLSLRVSF